MVNKFELFEDNGGGLTLFCFEDDKGLTYIHTSYEYHPEDVLRDLQGILCGENPAEDWDGNDIGDFSDPEEYFEECLAGGEYIADERGIYPRDCRAAGRNALDLTKDDDRVFVKWEEV